MRVAVTGSSGLVGRALVERLESEGQEVLRLVRTGAAPGPGRAFWDPEQRTIDAGALDKVDAVVHLAGATIGIRPWTRRYKRKIFRSRVEGTRLMAETLAGLAHPPGVLVSASAIGWYGDRGDEVLTEASPAGEGFRAEVCRQWEAAAQSAEQAGIRVVKMRFGIVLDASGGLLRVLLVPARLGLVLRMGSGDQYVSWISLEDAVGAILHVLNERSLTGAVNATGPEAVPNRHFARTLAGTLGRRSVGFAPAWLLRLTAGPEKAREVLLSSQRAVPEKLLETGFSFHQPTLEEALKSAVRR